MRITARPDPASPRISPGRRSAARAPEVPPPVRAAHDRGRAPARPSSSAMLTPASTGEQRRGATPGQPLRGRDRRRRGRSRAAGGSPSCRAAPGSGRRRCPTSAGCRSERSSARGSEPGAATRGRGGAHGLALLLGRVSSSAWKAIILLAQVAGRPAPRMRHGEQPGVARAADRDGGDRHAGRHLHDREQRVQTVEMRQRHRHADHRQRRRPRRACRAGGLPRRHRR